MDNFETIERKPNRLTGLVSTFKVPLGWANKNADFMESTGLKLVEQSQTPSKATKEEKTETKKILKYGEEGN